MWIKRDFLDIWRPRTDLEAVLLRGPRQIGKTSVLLKMSPETKSQLFLDDPNQQTLANKDPEFVISQLKLPTLIDEVQRSPQILFSIKKAIDEQRRLRLKTGEATMAAGFRITGSNQTEIDQVLQESLAGRVSIHFLHGLSVHELWQHDAKIELNELLFRGGFPELWVRPELNPMKFINDYIFTFIEKDIAGMAGVEKLTEFQTFLKLIAARIGELLNHESIGSESGVSGKTIKDWISLLERNGILLVLKPYHSNLNKRLIKMPKLYFLDTGLAVRLQGHQEKGTILSVPQAGHIFENLVVAEAVKTQHHFQKDWSLHFWRTKEKEEIDLIIESDKWMTLLQIKLGSAQGKDFSIPEALIASNKKIRRALVSAVGSRSKASKDLEIVPLKDLCAFLLEV